MVEYKVKVYEDRVLWYNQDFKPHRLDGPAAEYSDGSKFWYVDGKLHRLDGPAIEWEGGEKEWWIEGKQYSEEEFNENYKNYLEKQDDSAPSMEEFMDLLSSVDEFIECFEEHEQEEEEKD